MDTWLDSAVVGLVERMSFHRLCLKCTLATENEVKILRKVICNTFWDRGLH